MQELEDQAHDIILNVLVKGNIEATNNGYWNTIVRNNFIDKYRKKKSRVEISIDDYTEQGYSEEYIKDVVEQALSVLTEREFEVFMFRRMGLKFREISGELFMNENSVRSVYFRGKNKVKNYLKSI